MSDNHTITRLESEVAHYRAQLVKIRQFAENALVVIPSPEPFAEAANPGKQGCEPGGAVYQCPACVCEGKPIRHQYWNPDICDCGKVKE